MAASGWFAARPSGTENIYKIYAESFKDERHLQAIVEEAQQIVDSALGWMSDEPARRPIVFLVDVDNTLLDNDRVRSDLRRDLEREFGARRARSLLGDSGAAVRRARLSRLPGRAAALSRSSSRERPAACCRCPRFLVDYPFADRALSRRARRARSACAAGGRRSSCPTATSVFQPRKVERSGLWEAVDGRVLIYVHKEEALDDVERRYPARHYVMVDDKLRILAAMKQAWGERVTTVFRAPGPLRARPGGRRGLSAGRSHDRAHRRPARMRPARAARRADQSRLTTIGDIMKATQQAARPRPEPLARQHHARPARRAARSQRYIDELSVTGLTSNPTIFDQAIKSSARLRRGDPRASSREGKSGEALFFELALEDLTQRRRSVPAGPRPDRRRRRLGVAGGLAAARLRHRKTTIAAAQGAARARGAAQPLHQDPRHAGRAAGDRGGDLRRRADQRDAAVLARAVRRRGRGLPARHRAAHRRRAATRRRARSRRCSSAAGTSRSRARCPTRCSNRLGIAIGQRAYKAYRELLASPRWQRACNAGARPQRLLLGEHRHQGSRRRSDIALRRGAGGARSRSTRCPRRRCRRSPTTARSARRMPADGGDCRGGAGAVRARPASTSTRSPRSCSGKAPQSFVKSWNDLLARDRRRRARRWRRRLSGGASDDERACAIDR